MIKRRQSFETKLEEDLKNKRDFMNISEIRSEY